MSYTKEKIYNLAFGLLLLQRQTADTATDTSNEVKVLNTHWDIALETALTDMDLGSTSSDATLALIRTNPTDDWLYSYTYPATCVHLRRIKSSALKDNKTTRILLRVLTVSGVKTIYTNEVNAVAEIIPNNVSIATLGADAVLCIAARLAILGAPLIVGRGARTLREEIEKKYVVAKAEAQERDHRENFNFDDDIVDSEFVQARMD